LYSADGFMMNEKVYFRVDTEIESLDTNKNVVNKFRRHRKRSYETKLLLLIREKFSPGTPRTRKHMDAIRFFAVSTMKEHNLRIVDRAKILDIVVERFFIPTALDHTVHEFRNTQTAACSRRVLGTHRYVDQGFQKYVGVGLDPVIGDAGLD